MPKHDSLLDTLARLNALENEPLTDAAREELLRALGHQNNVVIAQAADIMGRSGEATFIQPLLERGERLFKLGTEADKQCRGKEAIVKALDALGNTWEAVYLRGIRWVQMEPVWGGRADTAANLRGYCAQALARMDYPDAHFEIESLLVDKEMPARVAAVNALAYLGDERSELLLRFKALIGDEEPPVLAACFAGLLTIAPERSVPFVAGFLSSGDTDLAERAALALGESRRPEAFAALRQCWDDLVDFTFRKTLLLAIGLVRSEDSFNFLLTVVRDEGRTAALRALEALAIYAAEERRREQIREAVATSGDEKVREAFAAL
ncbi:MAG: HEAT repeat domain-containing protein [Armatimonadota bacterium]